MLQSVPEVMQRRLTACTFDSGLCSSLTQNTDDNFDWTLTSEGTPTSNTGPDTGAGGEGAFMFIEANDQAEGNIATMTSSATGCALYFDYHMYGGGIGSLAVSSRNADSEDAAWVPVWTKEGDQGDSWQAATVYLASGSYYRITATRGRGNHGDIAIDNLNLIWSSPAPTATLTNEGAPLQTETGSSLLSTFGGPPSASAATSAAAASTLMPTANVLSPYVHAEPSLPIYVHRRLTHDHDYYYYYGDDDEAVPTAAPTTEPTAVPTTEPTLAPTNAGELPICNFTAGFCDWTQGIDDNFDWILTSEATPTSNTGPSDGAGHGGGAFIHIETNDQAEGNVAVVTSSGAGCGLFVDYHMYGGGIGTLTVSAKDAADGDDAAWVPVWTKDGDQGNSWQAAAVSSTSTSYYWLTATRGGGIRGDIAVDNLNLIWCTPAPTLAPTNAGELLICDFSAGFCDWTQDGDDNFDWTLTLTREGTPTTNTGPSDGAGHGGGAFIHIEANGQTEGAYAAITSSATGCGLYVDYHMYGGGIGLLTVSAKDADGDDAAWVPVWTKEGDQGDSWQAATIYSASGSYYQVTATRGGGNRGDIAIDNLNVIWCSPAPTATPTNEGDTHSPTVSPTAAPTPTPAPTIDNNNILNWADLKTACSDSACDTAEGGCTITLSGDFLMGSYTSEISFSGKTITIWGQRKVLDASEGGRFFNGNGAGSFLELHDAVFQNGKLEEGNDSCQWAHDGECDGPICENVYGECDCTPGTDTTDCGFYVSQLLSFHLHYFMFVRASSAERTISHSRSNSRRGTCNF
jgi:hypothetical protein